MVQEEVPAQARKPRVVLVDDDPGVLRSLSRLLRTEPYDLLVTENPAQVLRWITEDQVDLVVSDQRMPLMSGADLLEVVRDYSPETKCFILTAFPDTALVLEETGLQIERLIAKPWDNEGFKEALRKSLSSWKPAAPEPPEAPAPPVDTEPEPAAPDLEAPHRARVIRVDCAGRRAGQVIAEILRTCEEARSQGAKPVILLGNLRRLEDSITKLLKELARAIAWFRLPIDLRDDSGCVEGFLDAMNPQEPPR